METVAWVQAIGTAALVVVTTWYVLHTGRMAQAMKGRPYVYVGLSCHLPDLFIEVSNTGQRAAYNLQFRVTPFALLSQVTTGYGLAERTPTRMSDGLQCLPPGHKMLYPLQTCLELYDAGSPQDLHITVEYGESREGAREHIETFPVSFSEYDGTPLEAFDESGQKDILRELKGIRGALKGIRDYITYAATGGRKVPVGVLARSKASCPLCGEPISRGVSVCPHCQRDLPNGWADEAATSGTASEHQDKPALDAEAEEKGD